MEDETCSSELWDILKGILAKARKRRLAYLLFHCSLGPREIVQVCSQKWSSGPEISRPRRTIMERVLGHVDFLRWRLS